ncbi:Hpt domain-containing protein [Kaarinaea lacus]
MPTNPTKNTRAEAMLAALKQNFIADLPRKFNDYENLVLKLKSGTDYNEHFEDLFRQIHSLKGSAGTYGLHIFTTICHQMEDQLRLADESDKLSEQLLNNWLKFIDLMREALEDVWDGKDIAKRISSELDTLHSSVFSNLLTALVVTSSRSVDTICRSILENHKFNYLVMDDGYLALGHIISNQTDVLITTKEVSGLNGDALIAAIRLSNLKNRPLTTVLLTSEAPSRFSRATDPDVVIQRNTQMVENLSGVLVDTVNKKSS